MSVALANLLLLLFIRTGRATPTAAEIAEIVRLGWTDAITEAEDARLGWSDSVTEAADARLGWTDAITEAADARLGWTDAITDAGDARLGWTDVITVSLATTLLAWTSCNPCPHACIDARCSCSAPTLYPTRTLRRTAVRRQIVG